MENKKLLNTIKQINHLKVQTKVPLKQYTTMKVGGPADFFIIPHKISSLQKLLKKFKKINLDLPIFIMGNGSNIIAGDKGFKGIIIYMAKLNKLNIDNNIITAQSGISLSTLAKKAMENSLSGLEFAAGIPGSLGGALCMNAGAYGDEIKDIIYNCKALKYSGENIFFNKKELNLAYRQSIFQQKPLIAVKVKMKLKPGNKLDIKNKIIELLSKRKESQPIEAHSSGSIFKRPKNTYAGKVIEEAGLKGTSVGGAQVSKKHAGFIINRGNATATNVIKLIEKVQKEVYQNSGVKLELEPHLLGEFSCD